MNKPAVMRNAAKIVLTVSLVLNVLFLGAFFGRVYHGDRHEPGDWQKMKVALAPETQEVLKATFSAKKRDVIPLFKQAHQKKEAMKFLIMAEEFDEQAYSFLAQEMKTLSMQLMTHRLITIKTILSQLPQAERAKMAEHTANMLLGNPPPRPSSMQRRRKKPAQERRDIFSNHKL